MGLLKGIFDTGEHRIFERARSLIKHSERANALLVRIINGSTNINEMKRITQASDDEVFNISNSITSGSIAPNLIDDMLEFVKSEDRIVDNIYILSKAIARYRIPDEKADRFVRGKLMLAEKLTADALSVLSKIHSADRLDRIRDLRKEVERIEQEGDEIRDLIITYAYKSNAGYKTFYHMTSLAYLMDDVLDSCEDAADNYMSIMLSILT
jgi:uncharacterized protein Yka (UPF0111/DUF47 family)